MGIELALIWIIIIAFGVMMYVIMDGFDLGIGILFPFIQQKEDRDIMINTVAPVWDGNETWLVLGGAGLFAAFPLAYAIILSALYLPLAFMLLGLVLRGVAFEFRFKAKQTHQFFWDCAFAGGSYIATFFQGICLGAFITGIKVSGTANTLTADALDWLTPFSLFTGLGLIIAYALLGSTWLIMKTEDSLQQRMIILAKPILIALLIVIGIVSLWTPLAHAKIAARWFTYPNVIFFSPVPLLVLLTAWLMLRAFKRDTHFTPFILALVLLFLGYSGLIISIWPYIVPYTISIWQAAAPAQSMGFTLVGALFIIPFILTYTAWSYYVFRGKVKKGEGYHH